MTSFTRLARSASILLCLFGAPVLRAQQQAAPQVTFQDLLGGL